MSITREQIADLQPGDVVELRGYPSLKDAVVSGPLWTDGETEKLCVGPFVIRHRDGTAPTQYDDDPNFTLTVVSRAPRPLYVNHPRTKPVDGDIARDRDGDAWRRSINRWFMAGGSSPADSIDDCKPLTLLWDGETGQVVPAEQGADPLGHIRQGDRTPEGADSNTGCSASANNYSCTRERGHVGQHIAGTGTGHPVAAVWS